MLPKALPALRAKQPNAQQNQLREANTEQRAPSRHVLRTGNQDSCTRAHYQVSMQEMDNHRVQRRIRPAWMAQLKVSYGLQINLAH
jgi:hypothetical protein